MNRRLLTAVLASIGLASFLSWAEPESPPQPPCGKGVFPDFPEPGQPPAFKVWDRHAMGGVWTPPGCTGWSDSGFSSLVVTAARFRTPSGADGLLRRIGAISELKGMQYWSTTHQRWQTLIVDAYALSGPNPDSRRSGDFAPGDLTEGRRLQFEQEDSLSGKGTYEIHIANVSAERIVFETRNLSTLRVFMVPIFHPGDVQSVYFLSRQSKDVWTYYNLTRIGDKANGLVAGHASSAVNRAVAFYRHLAGIPTDQEPPVAP